jgi:DNA-directed RNA polymerase specialized sigma24 family protein
MERGEQTWLLAHAQARRYLRRFTDPWTRSHCDDLVQDVAAAAWQWGGGRHDPGCLWAAVRTIARRLRGRGLVSLQREGRAQRLLAAERAVADAERSHCVAGRRVPLGRLLPCVDRALARLRPEDRRLLLDFHAGFCCAELSARSEWSESAVKTRIHRARRRVQRAVEACVRAADDFGGSGDQERGG